MMKSALPRLREDGTSNVETPYLFIFQPGPLAHLSVSTPRALRRLRRAPGFKIGPQIHDPRDILRGKLSRMPA